VQINYIGIFLVAKALYPLLKKSSYGRLINIASRTYFLANPGADDPLRWRRLPALKNDD